MREGLLFSNKRASPTIPRKGNIMKRIVSNIQNLGFTIMNAVSDNKKVRPAGIIVDQTLVNDVSQGVSIRLINGKQRSSAVKLDKAALTDLQAALREVLEKEDA